MQKEVKDLLSKISVVRKQINKLIPFGIVREVKPFTRSCHVVLPRELIGKEVLIIDLEKLKKTKKKK